MKKSIVVFVSAFLLLSACKKDKNATNLPLTGTILLSGISDANNKPLATFSYNGKQLSKAVLTDSAYAETHVFNYDSQGNLTGTTISSTKPGYTGDVSSTITYSGGVISEIKFYKTNNVLAQDVTFNYANNQVTGWIDVVYFGNQPMPITNLYTFTTNNLIHQSINFAGSYGGQLDLNGFDNQTNICQAFPLYLYFLVNTVQAHPCIPQFSGLNNPTSYSYSPASGGHGGTNIIYTYNANNYPSSANTVIIGYNFALFPYLYVTSAQFNYTYIGVQ